MHSIIYHLSLDCRLSVKKPWYNYRSKLNVYWSFLEGRNYSIRFLHVVRFHRRLVMENSREGRGSGCGCIDMRSFFSAIVFGMGSITFGFLELVHDPIYSGLIANVGQTPPG